MPSRASVAMWGLLQLTPDDPQFVHLAATALLMEQEHRCGSCWSNEEMDAQRRTVLKLQEAWLSLETDVTSVDSGCAIEMAAVLHLAFEHIHAAIRRGEQIPCHDELVVLVASSLFRCEFSSVQHVR